MDNTIAIITVLIALFAVSFDNGNTIYGSLIRYIIVLIFIIYLNTSTFIYLATYKEGHISCKRVVGTTSK